MTRRQALSLFAFPIAARAQMASRDVKPVPFGKPSGLPFHARFVNVAQPAGLRSPVIYGTPGRADFALEAMGCGAAFLDYDNDGWLDILILTGSRYGDPPADASKRLYKNNRDGTFTDVTRTAGLFSTGYEYGITIGDYNNDGFDDEVGAFRVSGNDGGAQSGLSGDIGEPGVEGQPGGLTAGDGLNATGSHSRGNLTGEPPGRQREQTQGTTTGEGFHCFTWIVPCESRPPS